MAIQDIPGKSITIRLSEECIGALRERAKKNSVPVSTQARRILEHELLRRHQRKHPVY